jgi:hypothetical protein
MSTHPGSVRWHQRVRLDAALRDRLVMTLGDDPGDLAHRACKRCGAPVLSYSLRPKRSGGCGGEVIQCRRGHRLQAGDWDVVH